MQYKEMDLRLTEVAAGDEEALRVLYEECRSAVYLTALSIVKDDGVAQDVLQDTFIKIKTHADLYRAGTNARAWILTIARNIAITYYRKRTHETPNDLIVDIESYDPSLVDRGFSRQVEDRMVVEKALAILSDREREIVNMYVVGGLKHREIAEILEMPLGSVLWKYSNALKKMKNFLNKNESGRGEGL